MPTPFTPRPFDITRNALIAICIAAAAASPLAQGSAPGTVKGFVRVNGSTVVVKNAYAVKAPDSFDPGKEVTLVLLTPAPITADALAKAATRQDVFALLGSNGAIVEIQPNGHNVFLQHAALKGQQLMTGGGFPEFKTANNRISGDVHTFMPGDADEFGFKVRFELTFDAPLVKSIPVAKSTTATPAVPAPAAAARTNPPAGPLPTTKGDAVNWLKSRGLGFEPPTDALSVYLTFNNTLSADVVRVYLVAGAQVNEPSKMTKERALNNLVIVCDGQKEAGAIAELLLQAGANPNQKEVEGRKATPAMGAVVCPDVLKAILARKPDLTPVDANDLTAMHYALQFGKPKDVTARMLKDAGFDMARWKTELLDGYTGATRKIVESLYATPAASASPAAPRGTTATPASPAAPPRAAAIDWKMPGPYPARSQAEAARLLSRPGAATTIDDHFWDGITHHEPQRLALAVQAGANVRQLRPVVNYTPLVVMADRCEETNAEAQVSIANQLIAAGADLTGVDPNKANALIIGANHCPIGVIQALIKAGMPLQAVSATKSTALQAAILASRVDVVDALLDAGVDPRKEPYNVGKFASGNKPIEAALKKKRK